MGWVVAIALAAALVGTVVLDERELGRLARFLRRGDRSVNERATVSFSTPGISLAVAAVNGEMDALREERAALGERQEAFQRDLAALSHDIRTPLAAAQGYLQLYERSADPAERERCLREAASRLSAMRELTDRLFDYAKAVDADSPLACEPSEALPILAEVLVGAYPQFAERGWEPAVDFEDDDATVLADPEALSRVFSNLLANALRHGSSAPSISQRHRPACGGGGGMVELLFSNRVEDAGAIDVDRLFDRFYRADGARSGGGSGLGLAIVSSLCRRMGGSVEARVDDGVLTIAVALPSAQGTIVERLS